MNTTPVHAILFDLDGTLINSLEDLADAANASLKNAGYPEHPLESYNYFVGNGIETLLRRALPAGEAQRLGAAFAPLVEAMRTVYDRSWHVKTRPYPGIEALLTAVQERGVPMAVLSNKPHAWTQEMVGSFFPTARFAQVRGAMPDVPHKPDPQAALLLAQQLHVTPEHTLFVGDSNVDVATGLNAGMRTVGVTWGFRSENELREAGANTLIHEPSELLNLL